MSEPSTPPTIGTSSYKDTPAPKPSDNIVSGPLQDRDVLTAVMSSTPQDVEAANILQMMRDSGPPITEEVNSVIVETVETTTAAIDEEQEDVTDVESTVHGISESPTTSRDIVSLDTNGTRAAASNEDVNMEVDTQSTISGVPQPSPRAMSTNSTVSHSTPPSPSSTIHTNNPEEDAPPNYNESKSTPVHPTDDFLDAAEIHMHNTRIQSFHVLRLSPTYTLATLHHFTRDFSQQFCLDRKASGAPKLFTCASRLWTNRPCKTAQEYGAPSLARPGISHYFGHNKVHWLQVPVGARVLICRKHYQSCSYDGRKKGDGGVGVGAAGAKAHESYVLLQVLLLKTQVVRLGEWRADARFLVRLTVGMQVRVAAFHKFVSQGLERGEAAEKVDSKRVSKGREMKAGEKTPVLFAVEFDRRFGKENQSVADVLEVIGFIEEAIRGAEIEALPAVEFLLEVRKEDRLRLDEGNLRKAEREKQKLALPVELQAKKRGVKAVKAESDGEDDEEDQADEKPGSQMKIKATRPVKAGLKRQRTMSQPIEEIDEADGTKTHETTEKPEAKKAKPT